MGSANQGRDITPLQTALLGSAVISSGALLTFSAHYQSTAKKLAEEGVPASARLKALPLAAQALGVSTLFCLGFGVAGLVAWNFFGLESREVANVATFADAVALAKQQRVCRTTCFSLLCGYIGLEVISSMPLNIGWLTMYVV